MTARLPRLVAVSATALVGFVAGVAIVLVGLYYWPFAHVRGTAAVFRTFQAEPHVEVWSLDGSADGPGSMLSATHGGAMPLQPFPAGIQSMPEPAIRSGLAVLTRLRDTNGEIVGVASELEAGHEESNLLRGRVMTHTTWTVVLPGRGAFVVYQVEDNWTLTTRIAGPALLTGTPWRGQWFTVNTIGPLANGRGRIVGATGEFAGRAGSFIETAELRQFRPEGAMEFTMDLRLATRPRQPDPR